MIPSPIEHASSWFSTPNFPIAIKQWDGEFLVYHAGSGDTFVLDALSGFLLSLVSAKAQTTEQLVVLASQSLEVPLDDDLRHEVAAQLSDLYGLGLIDRDFQ